MGISTRWATRRTGAAPRSRPSPRAPSWSRRHWILFAITGTIVLAVQIPLPHATAWHYFDEAADLLVGGDGLHLYRERPDLQFGPLSILAALPLTALGSAGSWAAMVMTSAAGVGVVWLLMDSVPRLREGDGPAPGYLMGGLLFMVVWGDVAVRTAHIDDAITLTATAAAVWAIARGRPWLAVAALAVAGAAKPWGLIFAPLAAVASGPRRWLRVALVIGLAGLTWAPFVLAEPRTLDASSFSIINEASSSLRALGVSAATTPAWVRPLQLLGGAALAGLLVWRGRWVAVFMAGVAFRLLIDPAANRYYTVGLVLGLLLFELVHRPEHRPWGAVVAAGALEFGQLEWFPAALSGWTRLAVTLGVIVVAWTVPGAKSEEGLGGSSPSEIVARE